MELNNQQIIQLRKFAEEAVKLLEKAKWHLENRDASLKYPATWDNSAEHISNLSYIFCRNAEQRMENIITGEEQEASHE
jgi:hypothetical protein